MSYEPHQEDYLRLSLRYARTLDGEPPAEAARAFAGFGRRFARSRDSLPQTDRDRAFRLVADAATLIDYEIPFASDEKARDLIRRGHELLDEAVSLDPESLDADRMLAASRCPGFDAFFAYLQSRADEVGARCREARDAVGDQNEARAAIERELAMRPYQRWLATMAAEAVVCGRNRQALQICSRALESDPADGADVRFTATLALAKLEDEAGLDRLEADCRHLQHRRGGTSAWMALARAALAYKRLDLDGAREHVQQLIMTYPHAAASLVRQHELPDGVFARLAAPAFSEDELIVALSEATVLLLEGREQDGRGPFGSWLARESERLAPVWERDEVAEAKRLAAEDARLRAAREQGGDGSATDGGPAAGPAPDGPGPAPDAPDAPDEGGDR